jgi:cytochrome P450
MIALLQINVALLSIFLIGLLLALTYCSRWKRYFELGMKLPGPPGLPIIGNCLQFSTNDLCKLAQEFNELASSYSPIARLWFGPVLVVAITDPESIERMVRQDKLLGRGYLVRKLGEPVFRTGLLCSEGDKWRRNRKILSSGFQLNILEKLVENFAKNSDILANKLKVLADGVTAYDVTRHLMRCTLDIIIQTTSRTDINAQNDNDDSTLNSIITIIDTIAMRSVKPWLHIDWIYKATEQGKKFYSAVKNCHDFITDEIEIANRKIETADKTELKAKKNSLIDHIMQYGEIKNEDIVVEIASIIAAGTETTSIACGYVLALLGENQHIQEWVMQEQRDIFGDDILRPVTRDDLPRMVYLEQVSNC